jgi:methylmalonyl-CoA mutase N-terminal domain/subunit
MNNIIRVTIQALSAVMGGTQSLHTNGYDEALSLPTEEAATIALRTQQIIACESGVTMTVDPLGGSYFVEQLTNEVEQKAWEYIRRIDEMGGAVQAIEAGYIQNEIAASAYKYQRDIESKEKEIIGLNKYQTEEAPFDKIFSVDDSIRQVQTSQIAAVKSERDAALAVRNLDALEEAAKGDKNLMPFILACAESYCTLGEIADRMRNVFGEYSG